MKLFILLFITLSILSCNQSTQNKIDKKQVEISSQAKPSTKYIPFPKLYDFVKKVKTNKLKSHFPAPFDTLDFNKVIAYDFDGGIFESIVDINTNKFSNVVLRQKELKIDDIEFLIDFLSDTKTYGEVTFACFEPSLGIVFYKDNQICYVIDVCLDCNSLNATTEIPASLNSKGGNGFSVYGKSKIIEFSKKLGLDYGKIVLKKE